MWRRLAYAIVWPLCGAVIGFLLGVVIMWDERLIAGAFFAISGAIIGMAVGSKLIGMTGWTMLAGAVVGGVVAVLVTGFGKSVIYGVPVGTIIGLILGLGIEQNFRKPSE
jgi:outer membrane lipoprotein SlyB